MYCISIAVSSNGWYSRNQIYPNRVLTFRGKKNSSYYNKKRVIKIGLLIAIRRYSAE